MKSSELTDRLLLGWIEEEMLKRIQAIASIAAFDDHHFVYRNDEQQAAHFASQRARGDELEGLRRLANLIRLGCRIIDRDPGCFDADRPWSEIDADASGNERLPVVGHEQLPNPIVLNRLLEHCVRVADGLGARANELRYAVSQVKGGAA